MNKRRLLIITVIALLFLALVFKMRSTQSSDRAANAIQNSSTLSAAPTATSAVIAGPAKTSVVALSDSKPGPATTTPAITPTLPTNPTPLTSSASPSAAAQKAMRQIGQSYIAYTTDGGVERMLSANSGDSAHFVALLLAQRTNSTDASVYFVPGDPKAPNLPPAAVTDPDFANATLSVEIAANIPIGSEVTTTPIAWTRGLREDGTWAPDSPFGGKGGYLVFFDGHTEWVDMLSTSDLKHDAYFLKYGAQTPTVNIREALPPGAVILSAEPNGAQK